MQYFISLKSTTISPEEKELLLKPNVGGVVLYGRNILSYETTIQLISAIKSVKSNIIIAVDEEGGVVSRFTHLLSNFSQPYIATLPLGEVTEYYKKRSNFLKELGIDLNFAPVVDVALSENSSMYKRSYGSDLAKIIELTNICIKEQKEVGLLSCVKHFPGHGRAVDDSHEKLPVVNITQAEFDALEYKIFEGVISSVDYVMVGHLLFPKINSEITSVSKYWVTQVLRKTLKFKGKIISDDICMRGLSDSVDTSSAGLFEDVGFDELIITELSHPLLR